MPRMAEDIVKEWADREAETILDTFMTYDGSDDLLKLHRLIAESISRAYEVGQKNAIGAGSP